MEGSSVSQASKHFKYLIPQHMFRQSPFERFSSTSLGSLPIFGTHKTTGTLIGKEFENSTEGGEIFDITSLNIPRKK